SFEYLPGGFLTFEISKALDANERFFITYAKRKGPQEQQWDIWGLEWVYRPGMRLRVANEDNTFVYGARGQLVFDSIGEFFEQLFNLATFSTGKKPRPQAEEETEPEPDETVDVEPPVDEESLENPWQ
ncbi:MAG: hypothetical protein ACLFQV_12865, partial [Vulcanimicrobiota bacterium]